MKRILVDVDRIKSALAFGAMGMVVIAPSALLLFMFVRIVREATWLSEHGRPADGVVVGGESGSTMDNTLYCVEVIEFKDQRGVVREVKRECVSSPEKGVHARVMYAPDDPSRAQVDGDYRVGQCRFAIALYVVLGAIGLLKGLGGMAKRWGGPPAGPECR
jgi:hypothetical protein